MTSSGSLLQWVFLPPFVAIPTVLAARSLGSPSAAEPVDTSLWGLAGLLFVVLTVLYALFILQGRRTGFVPVQLMAQGILLCPLALSLGARMLQWLGVTMAVCGAVVLLALYYRHLGDPEPPVEEPEETLRDTDLPVPFAITDRDGNILSISDALLHLAGVPREAVPTVGITRFLSPGEDTVRLADRTWNVLQQPMKDDRFYFQLEPRTLGDLPQPPADAFVDPETGLCSYDYAMRRLEEELYRVGRYKDRLSAALVRVAFPSTPQGEAQAETAFKAYCRAVSGSLRASDIAFLSGPRDIFLLLPEGADDAAEAVIAKLDGLMSTLGTVHPALSSATLLRWAASIDGEMDVPDAKGLLNRFDEALQSKYTLNA